MVDTSTTQEARRGHRRTRWVHLLWVVLAVMGWGLVLAQIVAGRGSLRWDVLAAWGFGLLLPVAVGVIIALRLPGPPNALWLRVLQWTGVAMAVPTVVAVLIGWVISLGQEAAPPAAPVPAGATEVSVGEGTWGSEGVDATTVEFTVTGQDRADVVAFYSAQFPTSDGWRYLDDADPAEDPVWCWVRAAEQSSWDAVLVTGAQGDSFVVSRAQFDPAEFDLPEVLDAHECRLLRDAALSG